MTRARTVLHLALILAGGAVAAGPAVATDGALDPTFGAGGGSALNWNQGGSSDWVEDVTADDAGNLFYVGRFESLAGDADWGVAKLDSAGGLAGFTFFAFDLGGSNADSATATRLDGSGGLLIAGYAESTSSTEIRLCRLTASNLILDLTFGGGTGCAAYNYLALPLYPVALAPAGDGGWLVAGQLNWGGGDYDFFVVKFTSAGLLDTNFNSLDPFHPGMTVVPVDLVVGGSDLARALAVDHLGRVLVAGEASSPTVSFAAAVVRLTASGELDASFGASGLRTWTYFDGLADQPAWPLGVAVDPMFDSFVVGYSHYTASPGEVAAAVGHFDAAGQWALFPGGGSAVREVTWLPLGANWISNVLVQSDGRILAVGDSSSGGTYQATRLLPNGSIDPTYGVSGVASFSPFTHGFGFGHGVASATLWSGRLVMVGTVTNGSEDWLAVRLTSGLIFLDGFESGATGLWSAAVP